MAAQSEPELELAESDENQSKLEIEEKVPPPLNLELDEFLTDTSHSCSVQSSGEAEWEKSEDCCMGIDEAGRGPVLGNTS